jgi:hypothetical protein
MDIKKLDLKTSLMTGTVLAVISGFVPPIANTAVAGTATVGVSLEIVTAITLDTTTPLDFGRIANTGGVAITGSHTLDPTGGGVNAAGNTSVAVAGTPGSFNISGGGNAANVTAALGAAVSYNAGNIVINQLTFGGPAINTDVAIAAGATGTLNFAGGGATDVQIGGRIAFSGTPAVGSYNTGSIVVTITDIP